MDKEIVSVAVYIYAKDSKGYTCVLGGRRGSLSPTGNLKMNPPMGFIEYGESPMNAALREVLEETGIDLRTYGGIRMIGTETWGGDKKGANYISVLDSTVETGEGDGENSRFQWIRMMDIDYRDWAFGTGRTALNIASAYKL